MRQKRYCIYVVLVFPSPISVCFTLWPPNDLEHYDVKCTHICVTSVPVSQISLHFTLRAVFKLQAILTQVHSDPKMTWNTTRSKVPNIYIRSWVPKLRSFRSMARHFQVPGHFETNAPHDPKTEHYKVKRTRSPWTLQGQRYTICVPTSSVPVSQISVCFILWQATLEI